MNIITATVKNVKICVGTPTNDNPKWVQRVNNNEMACWDIHWRNKLWVNINIKYSINCLVPNSNKDFPEPLFNYY